MNSKEVIKEIRHLLFGDDQKVEMESATLVDGTVIEWEGELAVGTAIFVQTGEGLIPAPDATHELENNMLVTTEGGVVTEIVEVEVEVAPEEEVVEEEMEKEEFATLEAFNSFVSRFEEAVERLAIIEEKMNHNEASFSSMKEAFGKTVDLVEKVADLPSEEPTKAPAKLSKKEERFNNIINIAKQLKK
jgi:hypothetical protein